MTTRRRRSPSSSNLLDTLPPLTDEAAAVLAQFLADLHAQFESRYFGQIRRDHQARRPQPPDPNQPWLTGITGTDEPF
jgi:hypothetical protein